jgi:hypothetical protein
LLDETDEPTNKRGKVKYSKVEEEEEKEEEKEEETRNLDHKCGESEGSENCGSITYEL